VWLFDGQQLLFLLLAIKRCAARKKKDFLITRSHFVADRDRTTDALTSLAATAELPASTHVSLYRFIFVGAADACKKEIKVDAARWQNVRW